MADTTALLESVLGKTTALIAATPPDDSAAPTTCPDWNVAALLDHMVGWSAMFAAALGDAKRPSGPDAVKAGNDPAGRFTESADAVIKGMRTKAGDRKVRLSEGELPADTVARIMLVEYIGHGWDLAKSTGQAVPYTDDEAFEALAAAETMFTADSRGAGKPFGERVSIPQNSSVLDNLISFLGRHP